MKVHRHSAVAPIAMLVVCLGAALVASFQQREQAPVFRSRTDLVQLYATVRDGNGKPVKGLLAEDFSVFDNDQRVNLQAVAEVSGREFEGPSWAREHSVNVSSNEPVEARRLVVIILDDARMLPRIGRQRLLDIGREAVMNLAPDDLACVVFTAKNDGAQDFTADRALLLNAVNSLGGGFAIRNPPPVMAAYSVDVVSRAAATLANTPARRKMLVFVGVGQQIYVLPPNTSKPATSSPPGSRTTTDALGVSGRVDALLKAAQKAGIAVYVIDPRETLPRLADSNPSVRFSMDIAKHTGAIAVVGEPDAKAAVRRIYADASHYYVLGFTPDDTVRPGMYRHVRVTVSRPGLEVRSQTGYYPPKTVVGDEVFPELKGGPTSVAVAAALPGGAMPLTMGLTSFAKRAADGRWAGYIAIAVDRTAPSPQNAGMPEPAQMELRVFDGEGRREVATITDRRQILNSGQLTPQPVLEVRPGRYNVRLALLDDTGKNASSVYGTVVVPKYATEPLSASDVFVRTGDAGSSAWRTGVSSPRRSFSRGEQVALLVAAYAGQKPLTATVVISIVNAANEVVHSESRNVEVGGGAGPAGTELRVDLPLARLAAGPYLAVFSMGGAKTTIKKHFVFTVR